ncbi:MAG: hypothetical protein INR71_03020 [Terriglobus roseus]|nr:hypothetical protein [Terriglobus roseus]
MARWLGTSPLGRALGGTTKLQRQQLEQHVQSCYIHGLAPADRESSLGCRGQRRGQQRRRGNTPVVARVSHTSCLPGIVQSASVSATTPDGQRWQWRQQHQHSHQRPHQVNGWLRPTVVTTTADESR